MTTNLKEFIIVLQEELIYRENIIHHEKSLEATLWGLEEQAGMHENSAKEDQDELNGQMNKCRLKIKNCEVLLTTHKNKLNDIIKQFKVSNE